MFRVVIKYYSQQGCLKFVPALVMRMKSLLASCEIRSGVFVVMARKLRHLYFAS